MSLDVDSMSLRCTIYDLENIVYFEMVNSVKLKLEETKDV